MSGQFVNRTPERGGDTLLERSRLVKNAAVLDFSSSYGAEKNLMYRYVFYKRKRPDGKRFASLWPSGFSFRSQFIYSCVCPAILSNQHHKRMGK